MQHEKVKSLLERIAKRQGGATEVGEHGDEAMIFKRTSLVADNPMEEIRKSLHDEDEDERNGFSIPFIISDSETDRDNDKVFAKGLSLDNFLKAKAPVLWAHDQRGVPVARAPNTKRVGTKIKSVGEFPSNDLNPFGNMIGRMVLNDFLGAASIGFIPLEWKFMDDRGDFAMDFVKSELLEWSVVPVPANPRAVSGAKSFGIDVAPMISWCEMTLDEGEDLRIPRLAIEAARKAANGDRVVVSLDSTMLPTWLLEKSSGEEVVQKDAEEETEVAEEEAPAEEAEVESKDSDLVGALTKLTDMIGGLDERLEKLETVEEAEVETKSAEADEVPDEGLTREEALEIVDGMIEQQKSVDKQQQNGELPQF